MLELDLWLTFRVALAGVMLGGLMVGLWPGRDQATKESCAAA